MQLGLWAFSELGNGRELRERGSKGALGRDCQEPGPARNPSGDRGRSSCGRDRRRLMSREQELHGLSAKPAANLDTDNDEAAPPCPHEFWVGVVSLPVRGGSDSAAWLDIGAGVGLAEPREGRHDSFFLSGHEPSHCCSPGFGWWAGAGCSGSARFFSTPM